MQRSKQLASSKCNVYTKSSHKYRTHTCVAPPVLILWFTRKHCQRGCGKLKQHVCSAVNSKLYSIVQIPCLSEHLLQFQILQSVSAWMESEMQQHTFELVPQFFSLSVKNCTTIFLFIFNSFSTSPNSRGCVRIHCWKQQSSSCCPGAASSQQRPVDFQVSSVWRLPLKSLKKLDLKMQYIRIGHLSNCQNK